MSTTVAGVIARSQGAPVELVDISEIDAAFEMARGGGAGGDVLRSVVVL